ncbi:MAG: Pilin protein, partial [Candidatus Thermoplasmatota archaeon]|nr:Pilin protein [Candidatus Thermoplasmatota archaeon]
ATDGIELIAKDGTQFNESIHLCVEYLATDTPIVSKDLMFGVQPTSDCTMLASDEDVSVVLGPVHNGTGYDYESMDVVWDSVFVRLTDGVSTVQWSATYDLLCGESPSEWLSDEAALGGLSAVCRIVDLQGNGLANAGDSVCVMIQDDGAFHPGTEYTLSLVYIPTGEEIYSAPFNE